MGDTGRLACEECRQLAYANDDEPDCANCPSAEPRRGITPRNSEALEAWKQLDLFGRGLDGFSGVPMTLRIEGINLQCEKYADPDALRWRVMTLEERIYNARIKKWKQDRDRKSK